MLTGIPLVFKILATVLTITVVVNGASAWESDFLITFISFTYEEYNPFDLALFMMTFVADCLEFIILWGLNEFEDACPKPEPEPEPEPVPEPGAWWWWW